MHLLATTLDYRIPCLTKALNKIVSAEDPLYPNYINNRHSCHANSKRITWVPETFEFLLKSYRSFR